MVAKGKKQNEPKSQDIRGCLFSKRQIKEEPLPDQEADGHDPTSASAEEYIDQPVEPNGDQVAEEEGSQASLGPYMKSPLHKVSNIFKRFPKVTKCSKAVNSSQINTTLLKWC